MCIYHMIHDAEIFNYVYFRINLHFLRILFNMRTENIFICEEKSFWDIYLKFK